MSEKITVQVASIPEREESLKAMVFSLIDQVDLVRVMLNSYSFDGMGAAVPDWINNPKIEGITCDNRLMDGYKFLKADQNDGYVFVCDDDILYPPDFVKTMIGHHTALGQRAVLSIMGKNILPRPIPSYAHGEHEFFRAFAYHSRMYEVNLIGMCGAVYHSSYCKINETHMKVPDSDVCMSVYCKQNGIKKYVVPHFADWCKDLMQILPPDSKTMWLHNKLNDKDNMITKYINQNL